MESEILTAISGGFLSALFQNLMLSESDHLLPAAKCASNQRVNLAGHEKLRPATQTRCLSRRTGSQPRDARSVVEVSQARQNPRVLDAHGFECIAIETQ